MSSIYVGVPRSLCREWSAGARASCSGSSPLSCKWRSGAHSRSPCARAARRPPARPASRLPRGPPRPRRADVPRRSAAGRALRDASAEPPDSHSSRGSARPPVSPGTILMLKLQLFGCSRLRQLPARGPSSVETGPCETRRRRRSRTNSSTDCAALGRRWRRALKPSPCGRRLNDRTARLATRWGSVPARPESQYAHPIAWGSSGPSGAADSVSLPIIHIQYSTYTSIHKT